MLVLFDLDDTLLDHTSAVRAGVAAVHGQLGLAVDFEELVAAWGRAHARHSPRFLSEGLTYAEIRRARVREVLGPELADEAADAIFAAYFAAYESNWVLHEDAQRCLAGLAGCRLGIVSNGRGREQRLKLARLGIADRFAGIFISEELGRAKPDPAIFHGACTALAEWPSRTVYVGDHYELDAVGARTAGLHGVWLDRGGAAGPEHAGPVIQTLDQLGPLVERLAAVSRRP